MEIHKYTDVCESEDDEQLVFLTDTMSAELHHIHHHDEDIPHDPLLLLLMF